MAIGYLASFAVLIASIFWISKRLATRKVKTLSEQISLEVPEAATHGWRIHSDPSQFEFKSYIGSQRIPCYCPSTGDFLGFSHASSDEELQKLINSAEKAQKRWKETTWAQRKLWLKVLLQYILDHQESIVNIACRDSGKTPVDAVFGEILTTVERIRWTLKHGESSLKDSKRPSNTLMMYKNSYISYEPLGVVVACVSWNYPFHNTIAPVISALFAGNAIIVKGSEQTAWSLEIFNSLIKSSLKVCGFDEDLAHLVSCWPEQSQFLLSQEKVKNILFIGSQEVGQKVAKIAADRMCPLTLELGGKDAAIILDDLTASQLNSTASILLRGVFQSAGQNCIGIERIIAVSHVHDDLAEILKKRIKLIRVGPPLNKASVDMGSMINSNRFDHLINLIDDATSKGAVLHCGGKRLSIGDGSFFMPTLLSNVSKDMRIANEELFAPIALLMKAENMDDAIEIANNTPFGLGGSVFGNDQNKLQYCKKNLECGMVSINDFGSYYMTQLPFGGIKSSGYGRFAGKEGLRSLCNQKSISEDKFRFMSTQIPEVVNYPIKNVSKAWSFLFGMVNFAYGLEMKTQIHGLINMIANSI